MWLPITSLAVWRKPLEQSFGSKVLWTGHSNTKVGSCRTADATNKWFKESTKKQSISKSKLLVLQNPSFVSPHFFPNQPQALWHCSPCHDPQHLDHPYISLPPPVCVLSQQLHVTTCGCLRKLWDQPLEAIHPTPSPGPKCWCTSLLHLLHLCIYCIYCIDYHAYMHVIIWIIICTYS